jgi:hypothetical protein
MKDTVARALMIGDNTLYASAIVASNDIRGRTNPKSALFSVEQNWRITV